MNDALDGALGQDGEDEVDDITQQARTGDGVRVGWMDVWIDGALLSMAVYIVYFVRMTYTVQVLHKKASRTPLLCRMHAHACLRPSSTRL